MMRQNRIVGIVGLALIMAGLAIMSLPRDVHAALARPPYSTGEINRKLAGGVNQAIDWDRRCHERLREERRSGSDPRTAVNQAPSYKEKTWLSMADTRTQNNSSRTAPILVDYGTRTVPLQLNMIKFLCASLVAPDGQGADFPYTNFRVVRPGTGANDRRANGIPGSGGSMVNGPALTNTRLRIERIQVLQGNGHISGTTVGRFIGTPRQGNTRYWFANPVDFRFVSDRPGGLTSDTEVKIRFTLRGYNTYYYSVYQCYANGAVYFSPESSFRSRCATNSVTLSVRINIRYNYGLTPSVDLNGQELIEAGGSARVQNTVRKGRGSTNTKPTDWRLTRLIYRPGTTLSSSNRAARTSSSGPCGAFRSSRRLSCSTVQRDGNKVFTRNTTVYSPQYRYTAGNNLEAGSLVCFVASVSKPTESRNPNWKHSRMKCLIVIKKPKMQVHGSDVRVDGRVETSTTRVNVGGANRTYGSWVEYGALSTGVNKDFASGSALNGGNRYNANRWHPLTFANINNSGGASYGRFTLPPPQSLATQFLSAPSDGSPSGNLGSLASGTYRTTNLSISDSTVGQQGSHGKSIIIIASGTVTINGDITYVGPGGSNTFTSAQQIPQVVIIANKINIRNTARRVDAWLVTTGASGTVNTCSDVSISAPLTTEICDNVLQINGPVQTKHLYLRRTAGAGGGSRSGNPAEVFNLRAGTYLWGRLHELEAGKAKTVYSTALPPRF